MKLLEKDIHDKQDTIISLRRQLDDIKLINLEMYKKLQVSHILSMRVILYPLHNITHTIHHFVQISITLKVFY